MEPILKEVNVVMLATDKANILAIWQYPGLSELRYTAHKESKREVAQHLYFTSDEEIKEKDLPCWAYNGLDIAYLSSFIEGNKSWKKLIAATDKSLTPSGTTDFGKSLDILMLPQIPESFIKSFVEVNGKIDKVKVEYGFRGADYQPANGILTTPNNEVIIHLIEDDIARGRLDFTSFKIIEAQKELIEVLKHQIESLCMMSKIELGDDVIEEIKRLRENCEVNKDGE